MRFLPRIVLALCILMAAGASARAEGTGAHSLGESLSAYWIAPFVLMLASIAILPLVATHFWERNSNKALLSLVLGLPVLIMLVTKGSAGRHEIQHTAAEYVSFIVLLGSLFIVSGGILVRGTRTATPLFNSLYLALGAVLASFIGTTGASMLLIRPLLRANAGRRNLAVIVVFFIFLVSNIGGCLTPLGDPPLFLGYLKGVPFEWTFQLAPEWAIACAIVVVIFFALDRRAASREQRAEAAESIRPVYADGIASSERFRIEGGLNFLFLAGIVAAAFLSGKFHLSWGFQEGAMTLMAILSLKLTRRELRADNGFTFHPISEVAVLFAGIFATMIPALLILNAMAKAGELSLSAPWQFFWGTGILSSFLDNAPTYLTFLSVALGAVFLGAMTYIGNGPNFMVKAVAEENGVKMPSFVGYMAYSVVILIPVFVLLTFLFFA
jgi:Na+/H+ antiporter NhaD/arsenite permease-like protein